MKPTLWGRRGRQSPGGPPPRWGTAGFRREFGQEHGRRPSRASSGQRFDHGQVEAFRVQPAPDEAKTLVEFPIGPANAVRLGRLAYRTHPIRPALRIDAKIEHTELADHDRTVLGSCPDRK